MPCIDMTDHHESMNTSNIIRSDRQHGQLQMTADGIHKIVLEHLNHPRLETATATKDATVGLLSS
jgi:hypothetical protein